MNKTNEAGSTVVLKENVSEQEREKRARQGRADSDVDSCVGVALPPFETREEALLEVAYREKWEKQPQNF
ncbi:hypothetical protein HZH68_001060 [Vespula germanica]|uniref:Uncharacterized protein n=2 Tax=Vespula TaxID=7451 RepID=A0A834NUY0_VESGE|nr:hypothetical protein HZH68_001060 [Vespula germanica]KAF7438780.1 hypothetical protein H0235_001171 [Vespula pensylvanica]